MRNETKARSIIHREYGDSGNFMTPKVVGYRMVTDDIAVEISQGTGLISKDVIYGVSFVRELPDGSTERLHDLSDCVDSIEDANDLIDRVRQDHADE